MNTERIFDHFRSDESRVQSVLKDRPALKPPTEAAIPLPPLTRPQDDPTVAFMHDIAYGGSETAMANQNRELFNRRGVIPPEVAAKLEVPAIPIYPMVEIGSQGEVISPPIIAYFNEGD